ncbi:MAG: T9SS type A sorting domain-containing protein [Crocinitomicaceae bacterium]|nr:T9SS type A sorting domain-containing protein [Crocinitomicaceae bacterium]
MKRKITMLTASLLLCYGYAGAQTPCADDPNGFVASKNVGGTSSYQLKSGFEEKASQTYTYSGSGKIMSVRVHGNHPSFGLSGVPLKVGVYHVDGSGKPTTQIASQQHVWWSFPDNNTGYINVNFPGGVSVTDRFALTIEVLNAPPFGNTFNLKYTGNGEGLFQDLASLSGTSTGTNWASAMSSFGSNGDFYLIPTMSNMNIPDFTLNNPCFLTGSNVYFENTSSMTVDSMFNKIGASNYPGANHLYSWDFGDGSAVSHLKNPSHLFASGGSFTVTLTTKIEGWNNVCTKIMSKQISVGLGVTTTSLVNVTCNGLNNGSVVAIGQAGTAPYNYNINNGQWQTAAAFTGLAPGNYVLNVKDAKGCLNSTSFVITQPAGISFNNVMVTNSSCGQSNGALTTIATGGVAPLQYKLNAGPFVASGAFTGLAAGNYLLTIQDANSCTAATSVSVNSNTAPSLTAPNVIKVSCFNGTDGSITLSSTGGTGSIQYSINNGITYQNSGFFTGLVAGTYICVVKDNAGCTSYSSVVITQGTSMNVFLSQTPISCHAGNNGSIQVASYGGTGAHTYSMNGVNYQTAPLFTGLYAGTFTVYVKDVTSCVKTAQITLTQPTALANAITSSTVSCFGEVNGSLTSVATGGAPAYTFSLDGIHFQSTTSFVNLPADTFLISVKDANNCLFESVGIVLQPTPILALVNTTNATCLTSNGSIMAMGAGGSGSGFQYSLDGITFQNNGLFSGLPAGTHFVVVRDGTGCQNTVSGVIISAGGPIIGSLTAQNVSCNAGADGSITVVNVTGGTGALLYSKNGVNFQSSNIFTQLSAGNYIIQVKDANGCLDTAAKTILQPNAFTVVANTTNVLCHGNPAGSVQVLASGGAGFFAYSLNNGLNYQSGSIFSNLYAGQYTVLIKDAANCVASQLFTITEPTAVQIHTSILDVSCYGVNDGEIYVSANGGVAPYEFSINSLPFGLSPNFLNLSGDVFYEVHVRDSNNCISTVYRFINEPSIIQLNPIQTNVSCYGGNNGAVNLTVIGGVSPYSFLWSDQTIGSANTNLSEGIISVQVMDQNGCNGTMNFTITQPSSPLVVNAALTNASSTSAQDGAIDITATGGTSPYMYSWSTSSSDEDLSGVGVGVYIVTITDDNGCSLANTFQLTSTAGLTSTDALIEIQLYPNPTSLGLTIDAGNESLDHLLVLNMFGQNIFEMDLTGHSYFLNTADFATGLYLVKLTSNGQLITKQVSVVN